MGARFHAGTSVTKSEKPLGVCLKVKRRSIIFFFDTFTRPKIETTSSHCLVTNFDCLSKAIAITAASSLGKCIAENPTTAVLSITVLIELITVKGTSSVMSCHAAKHAIE